MHDRSSPAWNQASEGYLEAFTEAVHGPAHPLPIEGEGKPQIHMKAQFYASKEALGILARPEWGPILSRYLAVRRRQTASPRTVSRISRLRCSSTGAVPRAFRDGALLTAIDFASLLQTATWPATSEELNARYPKSGNLLKKLRCWIWNLI